MAILELKWAEVIFTLMESNFEKKVMGFLFLSSVSEFHCVLSPTAGGHGGGGVMVIMHGGDGRGGGHHPGGGGHHGG